MIGYMGLHKAQCNGHRILSERRYVSFASPGGVSSSKCPSCRGLDCRIQTTEVWLWAFTLEMLKVFVDQVGDPFFVELIRHHEPPPLRARCPPSR